MDTSDKVQFVPFDAHCQGALQAVDGNDEAPGAGIQEYSFHAVQAAAPHADPLARSQESVHGAGQIVLKQLAQVFHLGSWNRNGSPLRAYQPNHARRAQNPEPGVSGLVQPDKGVSGKERNAQCFPAVAPIMNFFALRQKSLDSHSR
ncbi:MAG: hypothetical protein WA628_09285 [Terriglobales bacterium]